MTQADIERAIALGVPLAELREYLDWLENVNK